MNARSCCAGSLRMQRCSIVAFLSLLLFACDPPESLSYDPSNWQREAGEETVWFERCHGVEVRTYRKTVEDGRAKTFRLELETDNSSESDIVVVADAGLQTGGRSYPGDMVRLFSPERQAVRMGEHAEFAAIFELGSPVLEVLDREIEIRFHIERQQSRETCLLGLKRRDDSASAPRD